MKKKQFETILYSAVGVGAMFVLLTGFNVVSAALKQRLDLTRERAYTLSEGTKAILKKIDTPIKIRFYSTRPENATPETVFLRNYSQQVEDLLDEFKQYAGSRLVIEKFNPLPDSDAEDKARYDGIEGQMVSAEGEPFYLGLAVNVLDQTEPIPFLSPSRERMLEYDVARLISQVMTPQKPVVGVMSALPVFGEFNPMMMRMGQRGQEPWIFINELKRDFTVKKFRRAWMLLKRTSRFWSSSTRARFRTGRSMRLTSSCCAGARWWHFWIRSPSPTTAATLPTPCRGRCRAARRWTSC